MEKPFLLIAGHNYYPCGGTGDWIGRYATYEEAKAEIKPYVYEVNGRVIFKVGDNTYDWHEIVDLRTELM